MKKKHLRIFFLWALTAVLSVLTPVFDHEGRFRRRPDICDFTPLRLNFKKSQVKRTLFDHQDKLKLVTHCNSNSPRYEQIVLSEYLAYRVFNLLTDVSFRVRLLRVTYVDTDRNDRERVSLAFLIEHRDRLAKRIGASAIETNMVTYPDLNASYTNLASVFHYFIGNTDYSPVTTGTRRELLSQSRSVRERGWNHLLRTIRFRHVRVCERTVCRTESAVSIA